MLTTRELTGQPSLGSTNTFTGIEGVICGGSAVYLGLAEVLNEAHGKTVLPILPSQTVKSLPFPFLFFLISYFSVHSHFNAASYSC